MHVLLRTGQARRRPVRRASPRAGDGRGAGPRVARRPDALRRLLARGLPGGGAAGADPGERRKRRGRHQEWNPQRPSGDGQAERRRGRGAGRPARGASLSGVPMSAAFRSNTEMLRDAYEVWNAADLEAVISYIHPQIRWEISGIFPGLDPVYEGRKGVRRFWEDFKKPWQVLSIEPLEITEPYIDRLIAHVRFRGRSWDGRDFETELWQLFILRDSALVYFRAFRDKAGAEAAAQAHD